MKTREFVVKTKIRVTYNEVNEIEKLQEVFEYVKNTPVSFSFDDKSRDYAVTFKDGVEIVEEVG